MISPIFIHGGPSLVIEKMNIQIFLKTWKKLKPKAIVIFLHWEDEITTISSIENTDMIYDFYGFPKNIFYKILLKVL